MSRIVDHRCRQADDPWKPCSGTKAKWDGQALFCCECDAWQRDKYPKTRKSERKEIRKRKVKVKTEPFEFGFVLAEGFEPEPEPEWSSSLVVNMVLAMNYRNRVKAAHDKYVSDTNQNWKGDDDGDSVQIDPDWNSYARKAGLCLNHGNALPCDEC